MSDKASIITNDLHLHSFLSTCCKDPEMTPERMLEKAVEYGYDTICITDHVWDPLVPGSSKWYESQTIEHIMQPLPLPSAPGVRFCFGCETEFCGGDKLGLSRGSLDIFDFILIPVNHFHMSFVRDPAINTPELVAELLLNRHEELQKMDLPWEKIGIPHFSGNTTFREGNVADVLDLMPENRLMKIFETYAQRGTGIEISAGLTHPKWENCLESVLRPFSLAKKAGCKFYFASDAHNVPQHSLKDRLQPIVDALQLSMEDLYKIPG